MLPRSRSAASTTREKLLGSTASSATLPRSCSRPQRNASDADRTPAATRRAPPAIARPAASASSSGCQSASSSAQQATATQCFQNSSRLNCSASPGLPLAVSRRGERLKDRDGQDRAADGLEPQQHDGPLDEVGARVAHAGVGPAGELEDRARPGRVGADESDDVFDAEDVVRRHLQHAQGDRREGGQFFQLLKDQLDAFFAQVRHG